MIILSITTIIQLSKQNNRGNKVAKSKEQVFLSTIAMEYIEAEMERLNDVDITVSKIVNREMTRIAAEAAFNESFNADNERQENAEGGI